MKDPRELRRRWRRALTTQLRRLRRHLESRAVPDAEAVHELRVALRRLRALLDVADPRRRHARIQRLRRRARRLSQALAPVRDADVCLEWAHGHAASPGLLERLQARRDQCMDDVGLGRRLAATWGDAADRPPRGPGARPLARRLEHRWAEGSAACQAGVQRGARLSLPGLHRLRRVVRRGRYLRELWQARGPKARDPLLRGWVRLQDLLGAVQNHVVVRAALRSEGRSQEIQRLRQRLREEQASAVRTVRRQLAKAS